MSNTITLHGFTISVVKDGIKINPSLKGNIEHLSDDQLLDLCIAAWETKVAYHQDGGTSFCGGYMSCGLCIRYLHIRDCLTAKCIISEHTGQDSCRNTLYEQYSDYSESDGLRNHLEMAKLAGAEAKFLKMLRDKRQSEKQ